MARVATTDVYDASAVGGIYLGFSPGKWQLADVRVVALRPILEAADVLARCCLFAYHPSLDKLAVKVDLGECSDQPWARGVAAIRFAVQPAEKDAVLAHAEIALDVKKCGTAEVRLPKLPEGHYELKLAAVGAPLTATKRFVRRIFPWERNSLGITGQVYPPFEPISVRGKDVKVVEALRGHPRSERPPGLLGRPPQGWGPAPCPQGDDRGWPQMSSVKSKRT